MGTWTMRREGEEPAKENLEVGGGTELWGLGDARSGGVEEWRSGGCEECGLQDGPGTRPAHPASGLWGLRGKVVGARFQNGTGPRYFSVRLAVVLQETGRARLFGVRRGLAGGSRADSDSA